MKDRITQCFNKGACTYDQAAIVQAEVAQRLAQRLAKLKAQHILEIGCGTGQLSRLLLSHFPSATFVITDLAPEMVNICHKHFSNNAQVETKIMDGEKLLADQFDLITSSMALHWFTNIRGSFEKIISKLSENGQFIFAMLGDNSLIEWREICHQFHVPRAMPIFPSYQMLQTHFPAMKIDTEVIQVDYKNTHEFLQTLKKIGAVATNEAYTRISASTLRRILRHTKNKISISYEVIYGHYVKV